MASDARVQDVAEREQRLVSPGSPYELVTEEWDGSSRRIFLRGPKSLPQVLRKARLAGNERMLGDARGWHTYKEVFQAAEMLASDLLSSFGPIPGGRIGIALADPIDTVVAFLAAILAGAVAVLVDDENEDVIRARCDEVQCRFLIGASPQGAQASAAGLAAIRSRICITRRAALSPCDMRDAPPPDGSATPHADPAPESQALIVWTSGSSSRPKAVVHTHRGITTALMNMFLAGQLSDVPRPDAGKPRSRPAQPCVLMLSPLSHVSGYVQLLLQMMQGGRILFGTDLSTREIAQTIARENVRSAAGLTLQSIRQLMKLAGEFQLTSLAAVHVSGYHLYTGLADELARVLPDVSVGTSYGLTETNGAVCGLSGESRRRE